jgi:hypothetical protein
MLAGFIAGKPAPTENAQALAFVGAALPAMRLERALHPFQKPHDHGLDDKGQHPQP